MIRIVTNRWAMLAGLAIAAVAPFALAPVVSADSADDAEYVGYNQCQVCHSHQNQVWREMGHARAFERLESDEAIAVAEELGLDVPPSEHPNCLSCHVTGYDVETESAPTPINLADGVQCESCHGPSSEHIVIGRQVMFGQAEEDEVDIMAGRGWPGEENCKTCHNPESPTWDEERYTLEDGTTTGFDFEQAMEKIDHSEPDDE